MIEIKELPVAILRLQKEVTDFSRLREVMIEITCDGVIDESEKPQWNQILKELDYVVEAIMALKFAK